MHEQLAFELLGEGRRLKGPFLSPCLLLARAFAHNAIHLVRRQAGDELLFRLPLSSIAWNTFASRSMAIAVAYLKVHPVHSTSASPFERIVPYLRQELAFSSLLGSEIRSHDFLQRYHRMKVAMRRLLDLLRQASQTFNGDLERILLTHIRFNEEILADCLTR